MTRVLVTAILLAALPIGLVSAGLPVGAGLWTLLAAGLVLGWQRAVPSAAIGCLLAAPGLPVETYRTVPEV